MTKSGQGIISFKALLSCFACTLLLLSYSLVDLATTNKKDLEITAMLEAADGSANSVSEMKLVMVEETNPSKKKPLRRLVVLNTIKQANDNVANISVKVEEIASYPKFLTLRAPIESVRVGGHARDFSVVADENRAFSNFSRVPEDSVFVFVFEVADRQIESITSYRVSFPRKYC